jgi:hypothetical protein
MRKLLLGILLVAICSLLTWGQCPAKITSFHYWPRVSDDMTIGFDNASDKAITAIKYHAVFIDPVGDAHDAPEDFTGGFKPVKPGKHGSGQWERPFTGSTHAKINLVSVVFQGGEKWQNDGSCLTVDTSDLDKHANKSR